MLIYNISLISLEVIISVIGNFFFIKNIIKKKSISKENLYFLFICLISVIWFIYFSNQASRSLSFKSYLFISCIYFSFILPRLATILIIIVVSTIFFGNISVGLFGTKYIFLPFTIIFMAFILLSRNNKNNQINSILLHLIIIFELLYGIVVQGRGLVFGLLLTLMIINSQYLSRIFLKYGVFFPFIYWLAMLVLYYIMINYDTGGLASGSNMERASMIVSVLQNFFSYKFSGPLIQFDEMANNAIGEFGLKVYDDEMGVDPHSFILSLWRDVGAVISLFWIFSWVLFWKKTKLFESYLSSWTVRIAIALLIIASLRFSLYPPDVGSRLLVSLIMGVFLSGYYIKLSLNKKL